MRHAYFPAVLLVSLALPGLVACGDDDSSPSGSSGTSGSTTSSGGNSAAMPGEPTIASCPVQESLIETKDWSSCVSGKSLTGTEPFNNQPCELRFDADGGFTYFRAGTATLSAKRSDWGNTARGTYSNRGAGGGRHFLASLTPEIANVEGQERLIDVVVDLRAPLVGNSTIEVEYQDAAFARQTYNCQVTGP